MDYSSRPGSATVEGYFKLGSQELRDYVEDHAKRNRDRASIESFITNRYYRYLDLGNTTFLYKTSKQEALQVARARQRAEIQRLEQKFEEKERKGNNHT